MNAAGKKSHVAPPGLAIRVYVVPGVCTPGYRHIAPSGGLQEANNMGAQLRRSGHIGRQKRTNTTHAPTQKERHIGRQKRTKQLTHQLRRSGISVEKRNQHDPAYQLPMSVEKTNQHDPRTSSGGATYRQTKAKQHDPITSSGGATYR